jgi:hypothetical protein
MSRPIKTAKIFAYSAGALLSIIAIALFISNAATSGLLLPRDPLLMVPMRFLLCMVGSGAALLAVYCLFGQNHRWQCAAVAWSAVNFWIYRLFLLYGGFPRFHGFTGNVPNVFHIPPGAADIMASIIFGYLLLGGGSLLIWLRVSDWQHAKMGYLKMCCPSCGGHIEFAPRNLGQTIPCPHCQKTIALRKSDLLKMTCFFCKEHIEFPAHAIGEKIPCPHCRMDITLKEPA